MPESIESPTLEKVTSAFRTKRDSRGQQRADGGGSRSSGASDRSDRGDQWEGWDQWVIRRANIRESIFAPYLGIVDVIVWNNDADASKFLGKECVFQLSRGKNRTRFFKGMVFRVEKVGTRETCSLMRIDFAAAMYALQIGMNSRIFERKTIPEIVFSVLKDGLKPLNREVVLKLTRKFRKLEYCVQYNESDLAFVKRLMAREGMTFYFDQSTETETVVLVDCNESHLEVETMGEKIRPPEEMVKTPQPLVYLSAMLVMVADEQGNPVEGAEVSIGGSRTGNTEADGRHVKGRLGSGMYDVEVHKDGYESYTKSVKVGVDMTAEVKVRLIKVSPHEFRFSS